MKKVDKKAFMALPEGTLFYKKVKAENGINSSVYFEDLCIKGETVGSDYYYTSFNNPCLIHKDCNDFVDVWINYLDKGNKVLADYCVSDRDGLYEDNEEFFVLDKEDVRTLINSMRCCMTTYNIEYEKPKYEYKRIISPHYRVEEDLNELANEGYRVINIYYNETTDDYYIILEREKLS